MNGTVPGATLWENMQLDESIRPFVKVLDSCGYKDILNSNQVFTVWAPEITDAEAQEWIDTYKREKSQGIIDDDNSTLNQFIKNHIAMYNQQVSSLTKDETVKMMNGKRLTLTGSMLNGEVNMVATGFRLPMVCSIKWMDAQLSFLTFGNASAWIWKETTDWTV